MKRSPLQRKTLLKRGKTALRRTQIAKLGKSTTAETKRRIQALLREIVMKRDGGCIFYKPLMDGQSLGIPYCGGYAKDGHLILQADHLISRGNAVTFGDSRLVVCVCKAHHGWKSVGSNLRKAQYDAIVRKLLPKERVALWDMMEATQHKYSKQDWTLVEIGLEQELKKLST